MQGKQLISIDNITKHFPGTTALNKVSFDVWDSEIHALVGENGAGKSTLMNIISGNLKESDGQIIYLGNRLELKNPKDAQQKGISIVHQELSLCQDITVAENIYMGRFPSNRIGIINKKKLYKQTLEKLEMFDSNISPSDIVDELTVAQQQVVEIVKALSYDCKLLILDEPTSSLTDEEAERLFSIIKSIKNSGTSILYISHRMNEIFDLCDRITVLRDGEFIVTLKTNETTSSEVVQKTVGRELNQIFPEKAKTISDDILDVSKLTIENVCTNVNLTVKKGEILGFAGLVGSGRTEIAKGICGILPKKTGVINLGGKELNLKNYRDAIEEGVCYLSENRKDDGLFLDMNIKENTIVSIMEKISYRGIISQKESVQLTEKYIKKMRTKYSSLDEQIRNLSGGNQQKVLISKGLATKPKLLIMDEPTRGVDVGAKSEIHSIMRELANKGVGVIIISSELPEIIGVCDRVLVLCEGDVAGELTNEQINEKEIMMLASGESL